MICFVGEESWRQKESKVGEGVPETWGDWGKRCVTCEMVTVVTLLESGADIVAVRHPANVKVVKDAIARLMAAG